MFKISKINLILLFSIGFIILSGFFAVKWAQTKEELEGKMRENQNLTEQVGELKTEINNLQKEIQGLKLTKGKSGKEVTITTDKTEYKQGEKVKASLDYDRSLYVWDFPWSYWSVQRKVNNSWVDLKLGFIAVDFFSHCEVECKNVPQNKIPDCITCQFEPPAWHLIDSGDISFTWNQKHITSLGTYQCYHPKGEKIITQKCMTYEEVPPGEYKIRLEYALNIISIKNRMTKEGADIKYAEKEFRIIK